MQRWDNHENRTADELSTKDIDTLNWNQTDCGLGGKSFVWKVCRLGSTQP